MIAWLLSAYVLASASGVQSVECLEFVKTPKLVPEKRLDIRVTPKGMTQLDGRALALLHVRRAAQGPESDVVRLLEVRLLEGTKTRQTKFTFARPGKYVLTFYRADKYKWPGGSETGQLVPGCDKQEVTIVAEMRPSFDGTRAHAWVTYRPVKRFETAASLYLGRLGVAGVFEFDPFGREDDLNRWNVGADVRWRGARGYLGGGLRYFPDDEFQRYRVRPVVVAGEELPALKGHPVWFLFDVRVDEKWPDVRWKVWKPLRFSFGVRLDITGNTP